jgi:hypothetical protein
VKPLGKKLWVAVLIAVIAAGSLVWFLLDEPYYRGRPVSQWAIDYSQKLYPSGTAPLSPSQQGLDALRQMGPHKASIALVHALILNDSKLYEHYRIIHPKLPSWYQNRFPLRLTHPQRVTLILGAVEFLDQDYQKAMVPFLIDQLEQPDGPAQVAACELLAKMSESAAPALPTLKRLAASADLAVSQAAQTAINSAGLPSEKNNH